jgi:hypothetical protein
MAAGGAVIAAFAFIARVDAFGFIAAAAACGFIAWLSSVRLVQAEAAEVETVRIARPTRMGLFMLNSFELESEQPQRDFVPTRSNRSVVLASRGPVPIRLEAIDVVLAARAAYAKIRYSA